MEQFIDKIKLQFPRLKTFPVLDVWVCFDAKIALLQSACGSRKENWLSMFIQSWVEESRKRVGLGISLGLRARGPQSGNHFSEDQHPMHFSEERQSWERRTC